MPTLWGDAAAPVKTLPSQPLRLVSCGLARMVNPKASGLTRREYLPSSFLDNVRNAAATASYRRLDLWKEIGFPRGGSIKHS
jgi:hypothetical protein